MSSSPSSQTEAQPMNNHALCAQTGGHLPIHDVNAYLNDPANRALLDTKPMKNLPGNDLSKSSNSTTQPPNGSDPSPMQLGAPESSLNLSRLYELCQAKGFTPEFTIEEDPNRGQTFTGKLCIGSETIVAQGEKDRWNSKKEAKQALALKGLDVVKSLEPRVKRIDEDVRGENWIGKLQAKTNAAKAAVEWLIAQGHLEADGTVNKRKKATPGTAVKADTTSGKSKVDEEDISWGQKVNALYPHLSLPPPAYHLSPSSPLTPNIFSGGASFPNTPLIKQQNIGEVRNVFGKKNAKEECARGVYEFLVAMVEKRGGRVGLDGKIVFGGG
ncbi:hypothetical protein MMC24_007556 [Lignoscripta atroalba]|nr:hypothetical protein [Lignoscripta atroalba]